METVCLPFGPPVDRETTSRLGGTPVGPPFSKASMFQVVASAPVSTEVVEELTSAEHTQTRTPSNNTYRKPGFVPPFEVWQRLFANLSCQKILKFRFCTRQSKLLRATTASAQSVGDIGGEARALAQCTQLCHG